MHARACSTHERPGAGHSHCNTRCITSRPSCPLPARSVDVLAGGEADVGRAHLGGAAALDLGLTQKGGIAGVGSQRGESQSRRQAVLQNLGRPLPLTYVTSVRLRARSGPSSIPVLWVSRSMPWPPPLLAWCSCGWGSVGPGQQRGPWRWPPFCLPPLTTAALKRSATEAGTDTVVSPPSLETALLGIPYSAPCACSGTAFSPWKHKGTPAKAQLGSGTPAVVHLRHLCPHSPSPR